MIATMSVLALAWNLYALGRPDWVIGLVLALGGLAAGAAYMNGRSTLCTVAAIALIVVDLASTLHDGRLFASADLHLNCGKAKFIHTCKTQTGNRKTLGESKVRTLRSGGTTS